MGLIAGIGSGLGFSGRRWTPKSLPGIVLWLRADQGITLGGTLRASGTTPPVLTITGVLTQGLDIRIACTSIAGGAARDQWTGTWQVNGGTTTAFTSAATVDLGQGVTLNIATGNAAVDNTWRSTVAQWNDLTGLSARNAANGTAAQQPLFTRSGINGAPSLTFSGSQSLSGSVNPLGGTTSYPLTMAAEVQFSATVTRECAFNLGAATSLLNNCGASGKRGIGLVAIADETDGTLDFLAQSWIATNAGITGPQVFYRNGVSQSLSSSNHTPVASGAQYSVGQQTVGQQPMTGSVSEVIAYSGALSATDVARLARYFLGRYGT